jgi:hypothetical protein
LIKNKKTAWDIHGGLKGGDLDYELLMLSSERTSPTADTLIVPHFRHLGCQRHVSAHVISSLRCFAVNTIQDEKCQSFFENPQATDYYRYAEDHAETLGLGTRPFRDIFFSLFPRLVCIFCEHTHLRFQLFRSR